MCYTTGCYINSSRHQAHPDRMKKIDLRKELKDLYRPRKGKIVEVEVPPLRYLMIDGQGDPNTSQAYADAVEALFSVSYTAKFMVKKGPQEIDYSVMPLEGLWWADDMSTFNVEDKASWKWTMLMMQPDFIPEEVVMDAVEQVREKKQLHAVEDLRLESFSEGRCAQVLHIGPFSEEGPAIERLHAFIEARSTLRGKHHEIYLSDIRRAAPKNWRTIIRQPMG